MKNRLIEFWKKEKIVKNEKVLEAFKAVPRELFILGGYEHEAYGDYPLPIQAGQTISQPTTVMIMTDALNVKEGQKILEIGTGSGYQAAILADLVGKKGKVITTEIIKELVEFSKNNIGKLKIKNIKILHSDGSEGYIKEALYDRIIVTAACPKIPQPLVDQLKEGGIIVAPVESILGQEMVKGIKKNGKLITASLGYFSFVPLKGKHGY
ncbi:MAG: protein-L-isoaspartate(D-aspartate) O-methyltransferase [Candidatus Woesearchaeota archaeon]|nr:protein-L-isoaspartate(D-aspartate) O-methyltransferase [Candidatus Woesearchaeota archaeon]